MSFTSLQQLVQNFESGGNYTAQSATTTNSGAYQFSNGTWAQYARQAGVDLGLYPTAKSAPPAVQDAVFNQAVTVNGLGDWTCAGCDAPLSNYLNANPSAYGLPTLSGGASTPNTLGASGGGTPNTTPPTASGAAPGASATSSSGSVLNPANWFSALGSWIGGIAARASLFVLAVIFILIALVLFGLKSGIGIDDNPAGSQ